MQHTNVSERTVLGRTATGVRVVSLAALDLVLPVTCLGCGQPPRRWCIECAQQVLRDVRPGPRPVRPWPTPVGFPLCIAAAAYAGPLAAAIRAHKDDDRVDAAEALAAVLAPVLRAATQLCPPDAVLVPAPSRRASRRQRGRDPVRVLCARAADGQRPVVTALRSGSGVADQAGLDAAARQANLAGQVWLTPSGRRLIRGRPVILVDDVVTTGATLVASSEALLGSGATSVVAAVLCATRRRGGVAWVSERPDLG